MCFVALWTHFSGVTPQTLFCAQAFVKSEMLFGRASLCAPFLAVLWMVPALDATLKVYIYIHMLIDRERGGARRIMVYIVLHKIKCNK